MPHVCIQRNTAWKATGRTQVSTHLAVVEAERVWYPYFLHLPHCDVLDGPLHIKDGVGVAGLDGLPVVLHVLTHPALIHSRVM